MRERPSRLSPTQVNQFDCSPRSRTPAGYRRAQSPFDVRVALIPWLSRADIRTSGVFEVLTAADGENLWEPDITVPDPGR